MRKLLIAEPDAALREALVDLLRRSYDITTCADGGTAAELIRSLRPDAVILDLMLPVMDGFYIMQETADVRPPVVLGICDFHNDYVCQTSRELGIGYVLVKPCLPRVVVSHLDRLIHYVPDANPTDGQSIIAGVLLQFRFNPKVDGFRFLKVGIPLYAQDPQQRVCKELYVSIARICGAGSWNQVERSIRSAIEATWSMGSPMWAQFFPGAEVPPTGKTFISRLSQILMDS